MEPPKIYLGKSGTVYPSFILAHIACGSAREAFEPLGKVRKDAKAAFEATLRSAEACLQHLYYQIRIPLYLYREGLNYYAIIDKKAYCLNPEIGSDIKATDDFLHFQNTTIEDISV